MDVHGIDPGQPFPPTIQAKLQTCDVLLALIGDNWLGQKPSGDRTRLLDPADFVRAEITMALERDLRVIPVLVGGATIPEEIPDALVELPRRQAASLDLATFDSDVDRIIAALGWRPRARWPIMLIGAGMVLAIASMLFYGVLRDSADEASRWNGTWNYAFQGRVGQRSLVVSGQLTLTTQKEDHIKGQYTNQDGRTGLLDGTLLANGTRLEGTWTSGRDSGLFYFVLDPGGEIFRGGYSGDIDTPADANPHNFWNGTRKSE